mgnify:CR=1 FL=1|jgi:hypothetical protein
MYRIKCSCGDAECSAEMEITEHFDEEGNIEILIYNGGLPNSIYMDMDAIIELINIFLGGYDGEIQQYQKMIQDSELLPQKNDVNYS